MYAFTTFIALSTLAISSVSAQCSASASIAAASSWTSNGQTNQEFTITVKNTGSCAITSLFAFYGYPSTAAISSAWNYNITSGEISNYGGNLQAGTSFNGAGFILAGTGSPSLAFIRPTCSSSCTTAPTVAPTSAPTPAPDQCNNQCTSSERCVNLGSGPACHPVSCSDITCGPNQFCEGGGGVARCENSTKRSLRGIMADDCDNQCSSAQICADLGSGAACQPRSCANAGCSSDQICLDNGGVARCEAGSAPTANPTPNPCQSAASIAISVVPRAGSLSTNNGVLQQIFDITLKATADISVDTLALTILTSGTDTITSKWNMELHPETAYEYDVTTYGSLSGVGQTFDGVGFLLTGPNAATTPTVGLAFFTCSS